LAGILPVIFVSLYSSGLFQKKVRNIMEDSYRQVVRYGSQNVDLLIEKYNTISKLLYNYSPENQDIVREISGMGLANVLKKPGATDTERLKRYNDIIAFLYLIQTSDPYIYNAVFTEAGGGYYAFGWNNRPFISPTDFEEKTTQKPPDENPGKLMIFPSHEDSYFQKSANRVFTVGRNYLDLSYPLWDDHILGTLYIDINLQIIDDLFKQLDIYKYGEIVVTDYDNNIIYANQVYYAGTNAGTKGGSFFEIKDACRAVPWFITIRIDYQKTMDDITDLFRMIYIIAGLILLTLIVVSLFYSKSLSNFVSHIRRTEAELGSLKAKIKPHFLYNTLEIIRMNAVAHDDTSTAGMVINLAEQMRFSIEEDREMVPLRHELNMLRGYFSFIDLRYEGNITWAISCDPKLEDVQVFNLMLQPIVENAFFHGIKPRGHGRIAVEVETKGKDLLIRVQDDGIGMEEEVVSKLVTHLGTDYKVPKTNESQDSIGIKNVHDRIRYRYGAPYGISIESTPGKGSVIVLHLPLVYHEAPDV
jgi:two-component system sensor histidine kinase YesM